MIIVPYRRTGELDITAVFYRRCSGRAEQPVDCAGAVQGGALKKAAGSKPHSAVAGNTYEAVFLNNDLLKHLVRVEAESQKGTRGIRLPVHRRRHMLTCCGDVLQ